ncbi:IclR family transcriptional regulator [Clostridium grantii]|uniref:Transcriptional regulator, IclR family n=1 Tax=Clostridium grantii DSM 8605 TaxID=1121316 RepID=A0A1M5WUS0_9CLOT|nr:IclR family transcriptional regulator [Clostridium grantii]SHH91178.1 transcriptional regulator, IclR family [Clostridium grantii DSM 8605]
MIFIAANNKYAAPAVEKALDILELMTERNYNLTVTEISNELAISVNSVFRIMKELEIKQYVVKDLADSSYYLTAKLYFLGNKIKNRVSIIKESEHTMSNLLRETKETILLTKLNSQLETLVLEQFESIHSIKFLSLVGGTYDSYSSAMGKCLLAYLPQEELDNYLMNTNLKPRTENTIIDKAILREELLGIKENGISIDHEESVKGLTCIACPVFSSNKVVECVIGVSGISFRMTPEVIKKYSIILKKETAKLSNRLCCSNE